MRKVLIFIGVFAAVCFCVAAAFQYGQKTEATIRDMSEDMAYAAVIEKYSKNAKSSDADLAEHALWLQLGEELSFRRRNSRFFTAESLSRDAAMTYVRLSELAKKRNEETKAAALLQEAVAVCQQSKSVNCQVESLLKIVRVIDGKETP
jgi:hypothetical protein